MMEFTALLRRLVAREDLSAQEMSEAIGAIMDDRWSPPQSAAFLTALAAKGETPVEVVGAAQAMRDRSLRVEHTLPLVADTCGTGGDGTCTLNISTAVAFVVAGCGVPVAKHGNRAASSRCGSADVLEVLGVAIDTDPQSAARGLEENGFTFMFAPRFHPAMKAVGPVRRELGIRTLFNLLGPISNPAGATHQVIGVSRESHLELIGDALARLGSVAGAVVHAASGMDEVAGEGVTHVYQFGAGKARRYRIDPADFDVYAPISSLLGGDARENAAILRAILMGERSPRADVVALNAALVLVVAGVAESLTEGFHLARTSLRDGAALAVLERVVRRPTELKLA